MKILLTGATGYLGGTVLTKLSERPDFDSFDIRCIVRSSVKADKIRAIFKNITTIVGSHSDIPLMTEAASKVDIVIAMANCDDVDAVTGTLKGLKKRFEETGTPPIFINTSGAGVLCDHAGGMNSTEIIWDDADPEKIATLAPTQPHRHVDLQIVQADVEEYIKSYIVLPPMIWGFSKGPLVDAGIARNRTIGISMIIQASLDRGQPGMFGLGKNTWNNIEIDELGDLYNVLLDAILSPSINLGHGLEGYYFAANEEFTWYQISKAISELPVFGGAQITSFTREEIDKYFFGTDYVGSNARCRSTRAMSLGWAPKKTTKDMLETVPEEYAVVVQDGLPGVTVDKFQVMATAATMSVN